MCWTQKTITRSLSFYVSTASLCKPFSFRDRAIIKPNLIVKQTDCLSNKCYNINSICPVFAASHLRPVGPTGNPFSPRGITLTWSNNCYVSQYWISLSFVFAERALSIMKCCHKRYITMCVRLHDVCNWWNLVWYSID